MRIENVMKGQAWVFAALFAIICGSAKAAFVNGVEDFNGTSVDGNTWVPFVLGNGAATVSNGFLDFSGQYTLATRSLTLGVGDTVSARVMLTTPSSSGTAADLGLTATPTAPSSGENIFDELINSIQGESDYIVFAGHSNTGSSLASVNMGINNTGTWFRLSLTRDTANTFTSQLRMDDGSLMNSFDSTVTGLPDQASVFIAGGPTARFDWVAVPEPTAAISLLCGSFLLLRRRRSV